MYSDNILRMAQDTLEEARHWLRERIDDGARCPCCTQYVKAYKRRVNASMARSLIIMYLHQPKDPEGWMHLPTVLAPRSGNEEPKMRRWGLIEELTEPREDGGRAGFWRITDRGRQFVRGEITIPRYVRIYDDRVLNYEGEMVSIRDALGAKFDYNLLMKGEA